MNGLEEKDYAEALGVELPETETPAEVNNPPVETDPPADNGIGEGSDPAPDDSGEDPAVDLNASAAARRRAMESRIERERERARQEERARMIAEIKRANAAKAQSPAPPPAAPAQNQPPARDNAGRFARRVQSQNGTDPAPTDDLNARVGAIIDNHPAVREARQYTEKMREAEIKSAFAEDLAKISEMDPSIQTEDDLMALPEHDLILELVSKGYTPSDAYKSVFFEKITAAAVERGKRQAASQTASTAHQVPDKHRGTGGDVVQVPSETMQFYRELNPGMSDADIMKHFANFRK